MVGRPPGSSNKNKPFRDALRMALAEDNHKALRAVANALIAKAMEGDVSAIREIGDRTEGKVPNEHSGPEGGAISTILNIVSGVDRPND